MDFSIAASRVRIPQNPRERSISRGSIGDCTHIWHQPRQNSFRICQLLTYVSCIPIGVCFQLRIYFLKTAFRIIISNICWLIFLRSTLFSTLMLKLPSSFINNIISRLNSTINYGKPNKSMNIIVHQFNNTRLTICGNLNAKSEIYHCLR